ncbi:SRPBCC family protein [Pyxidicoccus sp. 3LG]
MTVNPVHRIGAVVREVSSREYEGRPARVLVASRTYDTTAEDLWDALTNPERLPRWFLPISGDLRLGGRYELKGNASGSITRCSPPRQLSVTWEFGGGVSWVNVQLTGAPGGGTHLELEHIAHVGDEGFWNQYGPGAAGVGWDLSFMELGQYLAGKAMEDRQAAEAWPTTPEGKEFVARCSDAWGEASIAFGTDAAAARAAAARTTAFYTGG